VTAALALTGWLTAAAGLVAAALSRRRLSRCGELVVRACHEVRGPLQAARLGLHLLGQPGSRAGARVSAIDLELRRAALAVEDLHAARAGSSVRDRIEAVDVAALVREAATAWRPAASAAGVALRLDAPREPAVVHGDRLRLSQACGNLVANAIEHGGRRIEVVARGDARRVRIEVSDDGPGLPAPVPDLARRARRGRGRRGRGLAIAADIAARHGGRLSSAPSPRGARLALDLPRADAARDDSGRAG
jgi:signal transduction histidine kinase